MREGSGLRSLKLKSLSLGQLNIILILMCSCQSHAAWNWGREPSNKLHVAAHRHHLSETQAEEDVLNLIDSALDASISAQNDVTQARHRMAHMFSEARRHHTTDQTNGFTPNRTAYVQPDQLCDKQTLYSLEEPKSWNGFTNQDDFLKEIKRLNLNRDSTVVVKVDGFPCMELGCCQYDVRLRPTTSDMWVLKTAINEYLPLLRDLQPWEPEHILDGGGNIGVAAILLSFMFPSAKILSLEPEPSSCALLKENTRHLPNVKVMCMGLWGRDGVQVKVEPPTDNQPWGFWLHEVPEGTQSALPAKSIPGLMKELNISNFDFYKLDIENAEWSVFSDDFDTSWLHKAKVIAVELHGGHDDEKEHLIEKVRDADFHEAKMGEYTIFARSEFFNKFTFNS